MKSKLLPLVSLLSLLSLNFVQAAPPQALPDAAVSHMAVCAHDNPASTVRCNAQVVTDRKGQPQTSSLPSGYGPAQFTTAYNITGGSSQTIAIVDAYDNSKVKSDLDVYNSTYGLPFFPNCSSSVTTSCFQKMNQNGSTVSFPSQNSGWALEIALDVQVAHAACPSCKLILVEASSSSYANLLKAVDMAVTKGAKVVSMSWGSSEFSSETSSSYDGHFNKPGVTFVTSSGDSGYGASYPAASRYVTAVGGTTLNLNPDKTYNSETAWSGAGSGCSAYEAQPAYQAALGLTGCTRRMIADVSADADPATGAAVYDTVRYSGHSGWFQVGGTSLSSPLIAAIYARANDSGTNATPYSNTASLNDVTSGSNGSCAVSFLCHAVSGYDGPTGLGSPNGLGGF